MNDEIEILTSSKNYFNLRIAYLEELKNYIPDFAKFEFELFIDELKTLPNNYYLLKKHK